MRASGQFGWYGDIFTGPRRFSYQISSFRHISYQDVRFNVSHPFSSCRFQPFLAIYRMHVTSMLLAHRSKSIPYVRARGSNSCAHAMSMLLDIHSKCMSCAPRRLRGCFWKREVKGLQLYTVTSMCFLDPC